MGNNHTRDFRLRFAAPVLVCGPDAVQIGLDRRWAMRMGSLSNKEIRWLQAAARKGNQLRRSAASYSVGESRAIQICATLNRAGLLVDSYSNAPSAQVLLGRTQRLAAGGITDLPALSALRPDGQGQTTLDRRALSCVAITDIGRLGAQVALQLASAGVGNLQFTDRAIVGRDDVGPYLSAEVGRPRSVALRNRFTEIGLEPDLESTREPDLTISIETGTQGAAYFGSLHQRALPYLAVAVGEAEVEVGPFVLPSRTACPHCLQLVRAAADDQWASLLAEICALPPRPIETVLAAASASHIAAQALTFIDGGTPSLINALATFALPELTPEVVTVFPNPLCGCIDANPLTLSQYS